MTRREKGKNQLLCHNVADNLEIQFAVRKALVEQCKALNLSLPKEWFYEITVCVGDVSMAMKHNFREMKK